MPPQPGVFPLPNANTDPIRQLHEYLQEIQEPENLVPFLRFSSVQSGPDHQAVHTGTYTFHGVTIGTGFGTPRALAKRSAATEALMPNASPLRRL